MTALATVLEAGLATVQDSGRIGYLSVGVPTAGAWHRGRHLLAVALVHGEFDGRQPVIELLGGRLVLDVHQNTVVAVVDSALASVDGQEVATKTAIEVSAGSRFEVTWSGGGPTCIALAGWRPPAVLGSHSMDTFSRLGGGPLRQGTVLHGPGVTSTHHSQVGAFLKPERGASGVLRIVRAASLRSGDPAPLLEQVAAGSWTVTGSARSGVRLSTSGPAIPVSPSIPSAPMVTGAVQVTPSGEAIILGPDGGVTGGYEVAGVIATSDLDRLSMLCVGDRITMSTVSPDEAAAAWLDYRNDLRRRYVPWGATA